MTAADPSISVVIAARNMRPWIGDTLASVEAQGIGDLEIVLVDDGSTDGTAEAAAALGDPRLRILKGPSRGVSAARNLGASQARGELLIFLDADDLLCPGALATLAAALRTTPGAVAAYGPHARIAEDGTPMDPLETDRVLPSGDILPALLQKNVIVNGGTLLMRTDAARRAGGMTEGITFGEDWEFWCRLALLGPFAAVPSTVLLYRQRGRGANYSQRKSRFATRIPCLDAVAANPAFAARYGAPRLRRWLRNFRIDAFWAGVRMEWTLGSRSKAVTTALGGLILYPDAVARPRLVYRFVRSLLRRAAPDTNRDGAAAATGSKS